MEGADRAKGREQRERNPHESEKRSRAGSVNVILYQFWPEADFPVECPVMVV